jgi:hypothetical protein
MTELRKETGQAAGTTGESTVEGATTAPEGKRKGGSIKS